MCEQDKEILKTKRIERPSKKLAVEYGSTNPPSFGLGVVIMENSEDVKEESSKRKILRQFDKSYIAPRLKYMTRGTKVVESEE